MDKNLARAHSVVYKIPLRETEQDIIDAKIGYLDYNNQMYVLHKCMREIESHNSDLYAREGYIQPTGNKAADYIATFFVFNDALYVGREADKQSSILDQYINNLSAKTLNYDISVNRNDDDGIHLTVLLKKDFTVGSDQANMNKDIDTLFSSIMMELG